MAPPSPLSGSRRGQSGTRERVLGAAESLFVERGFAATSLRMITARAKVNIAAVNYHFGCKEALVREVFRRHLAPLNDARIAHLDRLEAEARGAALSPERIIEAMLTPVLQVSKDPLRGGAVFLRLLGRAFTEPAGSIRELLQAQYREVIARFKQALLRALPALPEQDLVWRMHFMFGAMSYTLAGDDALKLIADCQLDGAGDPGVVINRLVPFLTYGLQAPLITPEAATVPGAEDQAQADPSRKAA